ncbi:MAG: NAD(P)-dependent oxidoreductase [Bacteroidota bacterium]
MTKKKRILIVDNMHESIQPLLLDAGYLPDYQPDINRTEILKIISEYAGLIVRSKTTVDAELIDQGQKLEFIARAGSGMDKVDAEYLEKKNISAINAPEGNRDALGEHALGILLSLMHKIGVADNQVKKGIWDRESNRGYELKGKTVGIYGYGYMGSAFAEKLALLGCKIIAYDKFKVNYADDFVQEVNLESFKEQTEILSLHLPLTSETESLFNYENLSSYPQLKVLINTARGQILKLSDAIRLMEEDKLFGLGLDVLENEKLSSYSEDEKSIFQRLTQLPNVILTPHVGGWTFESYERINKVIVEKITKSQQLHQEKL